jgi:hypothetical protein
MNSTRNTVVIIIIAAIFSFANLHVYESGLKTGKAQVPAAAPIAKPEPVLTEADYQRLGVMLKDAGDSCKAEQAESEIIAKATQKELKALERVKSEGWKKKEDKEMAAYNLFEKKDMIPFKEFQKAEFAAFKQFLNEDRENFIKYVILEKGGMASDYMTFYKFRNSGIPAVKRFIASYDAAWKVREQRRDELTQEMKAKYEEAKTEYQAALDEAQRNYNQAVATAKSRLGIAKK